MMPSPGRSDPLVVRNLGKNELDPAFADMPGIRAMVPVEPGKPLPSTEPAGRGWGPAAAVEYIRDGIGDNISASVTVRDEAGPRTIHILTVNNPPVTGPDYAIEGALRYLDVEGAAYLEMWSYFADGSAYVTRATSTSGPMQRINGSCHQGPYTVPFHGAGANLPVKLVVNLVMPAAGYVEIEIAHLVQYETAASASSNPDVQRLLLRQQQLAAKLKEDRAKYGPAHPAIRAAEDQLAAVSAQLSETIDAEPTAAVTQPSPRPLGRERMVRAFTPSDFTSDITGLYGVLTQGMDYVVELQASFVQITVGNPPKDGPRVLHLINLDNPPLTEPDYAVVGEVRYDDVSGSAYLQMRSVFADGTDSISRTLADSGAAEKITGASAARDFRLAADPHAMKLPVRLEIDLVMPGTGTVGIGSVGLVQREEPVVASTAETQRLLAQKHTLEQQLAELGMRYGAKHPLVVEAQGKLATVKAQLEAAIIDAQAAPAPRAVAKPPAPAHAESFWFRDRTITTAVGLLGLFGCLGFAEPLLRRGKARGLVLAAVWAAWPLGIAYLMWGSIGIGRGEPTKVIAPLLLASALLILFPPLAARLVRRRYEKAEMRRMQIMDAV